MWVAKKLVQTNIWCYIDFRWVTFLPPLGVNDEHSVGKNMAISYQYIQLCINRLYCTILNGIIQIYVGESEQVEIQ